jgi:outer membrane protein assembly factor BamE (lipoprotein component of BamABCDE complex)
MTGPRRRWLRFSLRTLFLGLALVCLSMAVWRTIPNFVNSKDARSVNPGMTRAAVQKLLGRPSDRSKSDIGEEWIYYCSSTTIFLIEFDGSGRVVHVVPTFP